MLGLAACGGGSKSASTAPAAAGDSQVLTVKSFKFAEITVAPGATIRLVNDDDEPHTVTADDKSFDSKSFDKKAPGSLVAPSKPGTYKFHCEVHPSMHGTLTVR
ncbi:MAG: cupredoxin domain-containing protein [Actinomycetota bacterium]|nr:cupredoxin domain-containing protein [Actinomycetota bacterium]